MLHLPSVQKRSGGIWRYDISCTPIPRWNLQCDKALQVVTPSTRNDVYIDNDNKKINQTQRSVFQHWCDGKCLRDLSFTPEPRLSLTQPVEHVPRQTASSVSARFPTLVHKFVLKSSSFTAENNKPSRWPLLPSTKAAGQSVTSPHANTTHEPH